MLTMLLLACLQDLAPEGTVPDGWTPGLTDEDGDGWPSDEDCDDQDPEIRPDADELCDGVDNDCDGAVDDVDEEHGTLYWDDEDADGWGAGDPVVGCEAPGGWTELDGDCEPTNPSVNPDADELCDERDNDCDGDVDEDSAADAPTWYLDQDRDGWGVGDGVRACAGPDSHVQQPGDCDDGDDLVNPGMAEACDARDNDCSGTVDDGGVCPCTMDWRQGSAYQFCAGDAEWGEARAFCQYYGYDLVTINDGAENTWVDDRLNAWGGRWWAGYNDIQSEGSWVWSSGQGATYTNWDSDQPNDWGPSWTDGQDCLVLNDRQNATWNDAECDYDFWFICES